MAKIKFDKEKASTLINDLTTLQTDINSCLSNINSCGTRKDPNSSDLVVWDTVYYTVTDVVDGVSVSEKKSKPVKTFPYTANVQSYNSALESIQSKAESLETTSGRISKVINALTKISELIEEFENTPNLTLSAELGDVADHNFGFLNNFGGSGSAGLKGPTGYLGEIWDRIDITEFNRLGEDIIPTVDDEIPERIIDFDGDGKISITDYVKSYVQDNVNDEGNVVVNGQELGQLASLTLSSIIKTTDPEFLEDIEQGIERDFHVLVDITGSIAAIAGNITTPDEENSGIGSGIGGALADGLGMGMDLDALTPKTEYEKMYSMLTEKEKLLFEEATAELSEDGKLGALKDIFSQKGPHFGKDLNTSPITTPIEEPTGTEAVIEEMESLGEAAGKVANEFVATGTLMNNPDKLEDLKSVGLDAAAVNKPMNNKADVFVGSSGSEGGSGATGGGGHGDGHGSGHGGGGYGGSGNGGHTAPAAPKTEPTTQPQTEPQTQPVTEVPTQPQTQPVTEPPKHTPVHSPKHEEKPKFELVSKGDDGSIEMPILKDDAVVEEDKVSSAGAGLLGAAGVGAGLLNGGGNATPSIPSVDLGVTPPPAPTPSTMATPSTPNTPTTTVQNNTPMTGATPDMDDMIASQNPGVQQGSSNNSTHASRTTADTSSEGITKGKYSSSGSASSSTTSKQSKDTFTKDGEFKDEKDDNNVHDKVDTTKPEGVLGEASYAELIEKEEKQIKIATAITASSMAVSIALSLASVIDVIVLVLLLLAAILAYSVFRSKKKKNIKRLESLIRIEKIKKEETEAAVKEEVEETVEETVETEEVKSENDTEEKTDSDKEKTKNKAEVSKIKEVEEIVTEKKEFQSAEEVIYGEMPQRTEEVEESKEETNSTNE